MDSDGKVSEMAKRCHLTLVDFGFARALGPNDINHNDIGLENVFDENEKPTETDMGDGKFDDVATDSQLIAQSRGRSRTRQCDALDSSVSHKRIRGLSALGTRNYAAPEILSGIRNSFRSLNDSVHKRKKNKTLGACVSDYGMDADAFSVGSTIRHMVTGVSPGINVEEFIASKNQTLKKLARFLKKRVNKDHHKRVKTYRLSIDLPEDINDLIQILTHYRPSKRATVRSVISHPWIGISATLSPSQNERNELEHGGPIVYLQCAE